jgi:hypothetical protein
MEWLRICFANPDGAYNCGRCEKCLRTMISLRIAGALERCKTLPHYLNLEEVANMRIPDGVVSPRQNLRALERLGTEPELARALGEALARSSGADEAGSKHAESQRLQQQLSLAHKKLERTHAKLEASRTRSKELAQRNRLLTVRYSARRYRLADALVGVALRIPRIAKLVWRKNTAD